MTTLAKGRTCILNPAQWVLVVQQLPVVPPIDARQHCEQVVDATEGKEDSREGADLQTVVAGAALQSCAFG